MRRAGELIEGEVRIPTLDEPHTPNTGIVMFVDSHGHNREIDFIEAPLGLRARDVRDTAVPYELPSIRKQEPLRFWIMHPERCMESRVVNAIDLGKTDRLALRQLRASITCARLWSRYLLENDELPEEQRVRAVLNLNERVFTKCSKDRCFRRVLHDHDIDPFDAALTDHPLLPERFRERRLPQMLERLKDRRRRDRRNWSRTRTAGSVRLTVDPLGSFS